MSPFFSALTILKIIVTPFELTVTGGFQGVRKGMELGWGSEMLRQVVGCQFQRCEQRTRLESWGVPMGMLRNAEIGLPVWITPGCVGIYNDVAFCRSIQSGF